MPGIRGRVKSFSGTTLTLWNPLDARNFLPFSATSNLPQPGAQVEASATDGTTGSVRTGTQAIQSIDPAAGVLTASVAWATTIPALAVDDYLWGTGEFATPTPRLDASGTPTGDWIGARQIRIDHNGGRSALRMNTVSGFFVLNNTGSQPAALWMLANGNGVLILGSKWASPGVDLWIF